MRALTVSELTELHEDPRRCAELAGLFYVDGQVPGIARRRRGRGFSYLHGTVPIDAAAKARIAALAIPPAWQHVWICPQEDGHILATGQDDRGRKQYIYHPRWREVRDDINFYRLLLLARALPKIRCHVHEQLRRRTLDRDRTIAGMISILDASYIRIGNEAYAEENDSFGLSTLTPQHVTVQSRCVVFCFPGKSGKDATVRIDDAPVVRLVRQLLAQPHERLFTVDGTAVDSADLNATLVQLCGEHVTAKDFRTWGGTLAAFTYLQQRCDTGRGASKVVVQAVDEAAEVLRNTRAVARAHYVHPHVLQTYLDGSFQTYLQRSQPTQTAHLAPEERALQGFLQLLFTNKLGVEPAANQP